jgi:GT2 family glycosyltransferase/SAM-dependent methyltransferase/glycosyltransferase involved in cell wall biosynthesis
MKFTGERYVPSEEGEMRIEHLQRYLSVLPLVKGKRVLDLACGEGYGSAILSETAAEVVGVDVSQEAIDHATAQYAGAGKQLTFHCGGATDTGLHEGRFDVVVSFETIEHLTEQSAMLREIRRVLKPDGVFIVSSPNRPIYSRGGEYKNEFHLRELDFVEFDSLLRGYFPSIIYYGQRLVTGSLVFPLTLDISQMQILWDDFPSSAQTSRDSPSLQDPTFFVAVCAAEAKLLLKLPPSLALPKSDDLFKKYIGFADWAKKQDERIDNAKALNASLRQQIEKADALTTVLQSRLRDLDAEIVRRGEWGQQLDRELEVARGELAERATEIDRLRKAVSALDAAEAKIAELTSVIEDRDDRLANLRRAIFARADDVARLTGALSVRDAEILRREALLVELGEESEALKLETSRLSDEFWALRDALFAAEDRNSLLKRALKAYKSDTQAASERLSDRDQRMLEMAERINTLEKRCSQLDNEVVSRGRWTERLQSALDERDREIAALRSSLSWRLSAPARCAALWLSEPRLAFRQTVGSILRLSHRGYQALPLSSSTKDSHLRVLARVVPSVLRYVNLLPPEGRSGSEPLQLSDESRYLLSSDFSGSATDQAVFQSLVSSGQPLVSIIIAVHGQLGYTIRCLRSIVEHRPSVPFELIVVDDASPDDSAKFLEQVPGVRLIRNDTNLGYLRSVNIAAEVSTGKYLHLLNNDTVVQRDWLSRLLETFDEFPSAGIVGSKLIYPDGSLQEAGAVLWRDGSAWNVGRGGDAADPRFNYCRRVDYCSAASVVVPRDLFLECGGFDARYVPAYCEDADLCMKIRESGRDVLYQPASVVIHFEGVTSGTSVSDGAKSSQPVNQKIFRDRWAPMLDQQHFETGHEIELAMNRGVHRRVLVLDHCTPTPDQDAGSVTALNTMILLREMGFQVTFIPEDNYLFDRHYSLQLQRRGIEALYLPFVQSVERHLKLHGKRYDLVFVFRPVVFERHYTSIKKYCERGKIVYHAMDLHFLRMSREAELYPGRASRAAIDEMRKRELLAISKSDAAIVHSAKEVEVLSEALSGSKLHIIPLVLDVRGTEAAFATRRGIVFVGGYQHGPNVDAVQFFSQEVMPLIAQRLPDVSFNIVGSKLPPEVRSLQAPNVNIEGFVDNLPLFLDSMRLFVAPLRYGAGVKGKVGVALASGIPVIGTSVAFEGMELVDGEDVIVANSKEEFASSVESIYNNQMEWERLSARGIARAEELWGSRAGYQALRKVLVDIGFDIRETESPIRCYQS